MFDGIFRKSDKRKVSQDKGNSSKEEVAALEEGIENLRVSSTSTESITRQSKPLPEPAYNTRSVTKDWKKERKIALRRLTVAKNDLKDNRYKFMNPEARYKYYMYTRDYYLGKSYSSNKDYNFNSDKKGHLTVNALEEYIECYVRYIEELDANLSEYFNVAQLENRIFNTEMLARTKKYFDDHASYQNNLINAYYAHIKLPQDHHIL